MPFKNMFYSVTAMIQWVLTLYIHLKYISVCSLWF